MLYDFTQEKLRSVCRQNVESLEIWARRIIHEELTRNYGTDYFNHQFKNGEYLIKGEIRAKSKQLQQKEPHRFQRYVDTLFLDEIIYLLCKPTLYAKHFKKVLDIKYLQGVEEAREFLERIVPIRNSLSHSNPISVREAEMAICYSNDFIDGIKAYYLNEGKEKMWNVPTILRATDSAGNVLYTNSDGLAEIHPCFLSVIHTLSI